MNNSIIDTISDLIYKSRRLDSAIDYCNDMLQSPTIPYSEKVVYRIIVDMLEKEDDQN
jgi:hypothetical protein